MLRKAAERMPQLLKKASREEISACFSIYGRWGLFSVYYRPTISRRAIESGAFLGSVWQRLIMYNKSPAEVWRLRRGRDNRYEEEGGGRTYSQPRAEAPRTAASEPLRVETRSFAFTLKIFNTFSS